MICVPHVLRPRAAFLAAGILLTASVSASALNGKPAVDRDTIVMAISKEIFNLDGQVSASGDSQR